MEGTEHVLKPNGTTIKNNGKLDDGWYSLPDDLLYLKTNFVSM